MVKVRPKTILKGVFVYVQSDHSYFPSKAQVKRGFYVYRSKNDRAARVRSARCGFVF